MGERCVAVLSVLSVESAAADRLRGELYLTEKCQVINVTHKTLGSDRSDAVL